MTENQKTETKESAATEAPEKDPVRQWTLRILVLSVIMLIGYLVADRITPSRLRDEEGNDRVTVIAFRLPL